MPGDDADVRRALIIGTSRGLGLALRDEHLRRGWDVIGTVRSASDRPPDTDRLTTRLLDTSDFAAIDALHDALDRPVDRLFVVAGVTGPTDPIGQVGADAFADALLVNTLAPLRIVDRFADLTTPTATVAVMSSSQGSIALNDDGGNETYRISKAGLNMGLRSIVARRSDRRTYLAVNPGWVQTDMGTSAASLTIEQSIPKVVDVLDAHENEGGVGFVDLDDRTLPW